MTDDMQRARELLAQHAEVMPACYFSGMSNAVSEHEALAAIAAALRAAPEVPAARVTEPLRADESRQEQADSAIYNRGWNDCRAAMLAARPREVK